MSERIFGRWAGTLALAFLGVGLLAVDGRTDRGPIDLPSSSEPRVAVGKSDSDAGFRVSAGLGEAFKRHPAGTSVYSRDLLLALPGFQADVTPASKNVKLTLYGNLPELSDGSVLESAVVMHDTSAYDLDFTLQRGRVVLTNTKKEGEAKVWMRTEMAGVQLTLHEPGDKVAIDISGRWAPGTPFTLKGGAKHRPVTLWDVYVLKGKVDAKAGKNEFHMSAHPGRAYFHGDSVHGPAEEGPQPLKEVPAWADEKAMAKSPALKMAQEVSKAYRKIIDESDESERVPLLLAAAAKDKNKARALMFRRLVVFALAAMDEVDKVAKLLNESTYDEVRHTAVIALRHWIGARAGRDEKLYQVLIEDVRFSKGEAETLMQLLHSPFDPEQAETYETLIAYLKHRRQAVRELAHWHLVRLAPVGRKLPFDSGAAAAEREKMAAAWEKLIPAGTLPKEPEAKKKEEKKEEK